MRVVAAESMWREPLKWDRLAVGRRRVFCASMADVFEDWVSIVHRANGETLRADVSGWDQWSDVSGVITLSTVRRRLFELIDKTPNLDWLLLTKRPENITKMLPTEWLRQPRANVWLGTSVEDQETAKLRIPQLLKVPAAVRFLSCEPLLGDVNLDEWLIPCCERGDKEGSSPCAICINNGYRKYEPSGINWVIIGGESGIRSRPCRIEWIRNIVGQCKAAGVSVFVKQLGHFVLAGDGIDPIDQFPNDAIPNFSQGPDQFTATIHLRHPKGGNIDEFPTDLQIREFPNP